ncbi:hypothetical protein ELE36_02100 [Pseudolysobacter antarcticus]|uniref:Esterase n=1 Tax=Pseudolysobacter antarcticus TaxID=2511995 RepID=A0A411HFK5_9GAMM|nr:PHB depolymerase family esterase [Pseudolysobacter antarcticus]QBB69260.1 hypothetical protein ELE36_02100 [Pseudolysobacter antarcticus]
MKSRHWLSLLIALLMPAADVAAVSSIALPAWVCSKPDAIFINGFETANAIPHDASLGNGGAYPGNVARSITVAGYATETYYLHIPANYNPARAAPLLVVLHGASGSHADAITDAQFLRSDWSSLADTYGFIVIAPVGEQSQGGWITPPGAPTDYDMIAAAFTDATIAYNIERSRRYLWGFSAGGYVAPDIVLNGFNSTINANVLAAYSINSANIDFACTAGAGGCNALLNSQTRRVPIDIHIGTQDDPQLLASVRADHTGLLAHGWVDGSTLFYTEFNDGHTYTNQLTGAWQSLCGFALSP